MSIKRDRMADRIREILSELLLREVADPRLQGVTITEVKLDPELMYAAVYVNALGEEHREKEVLLGLKHASGFLRREVGQRIRVRNTPELHFHWDTTLERGEYLNQIINSLNIPKATDEDTEQE
ncbi:MAG TPA: 30S ribosome-binding factor RbfA [Aggregatilineales bacterium]|jgi:ribosome-binding factor A|nr:30S ribosome-binding factor RbfA [Aggregatilineales bacterium]